MSNRYLKFSMAPLECFIPGLSYLKNFAPYLIYYSISIYGTAQDKKKIKGEQFFFSNLIIKDSPFSLTLVLQPSLPVCTLPSACQKYLICTSFSRFHESTLPKPLSHLTSSSILTYLHFIPQQWIIFMAVSHLFQNSREKQATTLLKSI